MKFRLNPFRKENIKITSKFGNRKFFNNVTKKFGSGFHNGIDLVGKGDVCSITSGEVVSIRNNISGYSEKYGSGNYVKVKFDDYLVVYYHLKKNSIKLCKGDLVNIGDFIGIMDKTGHATGKHLHLGIKYKDNWINPLPYLIGDKIFNNNVYIIKKGDTLSSIAFKFNTTIEELVKLNNLINKDLIYEGDTLILPNNNFVYYVVEKGDNLSSIAKKYNTSWRKIYNENKEIIGNDPNLIKKGQKLKIYL